MGDALPVSSVRFLSFCSLERESLSSQWEPVSGIWVPFFRAERESFEALQAVVAAMNRKEEALAKLKSRRLFRVEPAFSENPGNFLDLEGNWEEYLRQRELPIKEIWVAQVNSLQSQASQLLKHYPRASAETEPKPQPTPTPAAMGNEREYRDDQPHHGSINEPPQAQSNIDGQCGVTLADAALFVLEEDSQDAKREVKRIVDSKRFTFKPIGKCPNDGRANLYELSEVLESFTKFYGLSQSEKTLLRKHLTAKLRRPK